MNAKRLIWLCVALAAVAAVRCVVFVDEAEFVIVTQFGDPVRMIDQPGLAWKAPYQATIRMDRRLQVYAPRPSEFLAKEKKNVDLEALVCWRVGEPQKFLETVNDFPGAEARLHDLVWSELAAEVGRNSLDALVSNDPEKHQLDALVGRVADRCRQSAARAYGIELVDVRLKRIGLPAQVRDSVFQRMRAERARIARQYRAEGEEEAVKIRTAADKKRTEALADAYAAAEKVRGQAEAEATRIYAAAHQKDPAFYELVRTLESYGKLLDEKTTLLLSADSDLLKYLVRGPAAAGEAKSGTPPGGGSGK